MSVNKLKENEISIELNIGIMNIELVFERLIREHKIVLYRGLIGVRMEHPLESGEVGVEEKVEEEFGEEGVLVENIGQIYKGYFEDQILVVVFEHRSEGLREREHSVSELLNERVLFGLKEFARWILIIVETDVHVLFAGDYFSDEFGKHYDDQTFALPPVVPAQFLLVAHHQLVHQLVVDLQQTGHQTQRHRLLVYLPTFHIAAAVMSHLVQKHTVLFLVPFLLFHQDSQTLQKHAHIIHSCFQTLYHLQSTRSIHITKKIHYLY